MIGALGTPAGPSDPFGIWLPNGRIEEHGHAAVRRVLVGRLEVERAAEKLTQLAPKVVDSAVCQCHVGDTLGAALHLVGRPEPRVDVDSLKTVGVPGDPDRAISFHENILPRSVRTSRLPTGSVATDHACLP